jgi:hypothetical protein
MPWERNGDVGPVAVSRQCGRCLGQQRNGSDEADHDGAGHEQPADRRPLLARTEVPSDKARDVQDVGEHMGRHRCEPDDERRLVEPQEDAALRAERHEQQTGPEENRRRHDDQRSDQQPQERRRRTAANVVVTSTVVRGEAPRRASGLQENYRHQQHAEEDMDRGYPTDERDRRALGRQQHQQDSRRCRSQPGIPFRRHSRKFS